MKITRMYNQSRRDFTYDAECETCAATVEGLSGYDDHNFHQNVVPAMKCSVCGEASPDEVGDRPTPRYPGRMTV